MRRRGREQRMASGLCPGAGGSAWQVQTDLQRGFGLAALGIWGTLGSVVLRTKPCTLTQRASGLCHVPLVQLQRVQTSGIDIGYQPVCRQLSVSHHLSKRWIGCWTPCVGKSSGSECTWTPDSTGMIFVVVSDFHRTAGLGESLDVSRAYLG